MANLLLYKIVKPDFAIGPKIKIRKGSQMKKLFLTITTFLSAKVHFYELSPHVRIRPTAGVVLFIIFLSSTIFAAPQIVGSGLGCEQNKCVWLKAGGLSSAAFEIKVTPRLGPSITETYFSSTIRQDGLYKIITFRLSDMSYQKLSRGGLTIVLIEKNIQSNPAIVPLPQTALVGGSNYHWFSSGETTELNCLSWRTNGVVKNYHLNRTQIRSDLRRLYESGQRRLRTGIYFGHGAGETAFDSSQKEIPEQIKSNLRSFFADIKAQGFAEIEFGIFALRPNLPTDPGWRPEYLEENWKMIQQSREIIGASGLPFYFDLGNEHLNMAWDTAKGLPYLKEIWRRYTSAFGADRTVGFSAIIHSDIINYAAQVYGSQFPSTFDFHIYGYAGTLNRNLSAYDLYRLVDLKIKEFENQSGRRLSQKIIIGEAYSNDEQAARELRLAIINTRRTPLFLLQWPLSRNRPCGPTSNIDYVPINRDRYFHLGL